MKNVTKKYDVVCMIDTALSQEKQKKLIDDVTSLLKTHGTIHTIDDIGELDVVSNPSKKDRFYYYSVCFEHDGSAIKDMQYQLGLMKGLYRSFFYAMKPQEEFLLYKDVVAHIDTFFEKSEDVAEEE